MRKIVTGALLLLLTLPGLALAQVSIVSSKHNLSSSGTGSIKASSESQICVFCHTPHGSSNIAQLWNKQTTSAGYTLYSSDYITSLPSYPAPAQPKTRSKLCLSCHDGTVALGSVYNLPGSGGGAGGTISMTQSGSPITTMPAGAAGYLGTLLTDDHPVGYMYNTTSDAELVVRGWPWGTAVKLDPDASTGTVECQSCHEPHNNQFTKFLRMSNANAALCTHCHNKTGYAVSAHPNATTQSYTPAGGTATTVAEWSCRSCHKPHSSGGTPYILRAVEQNTCYESGCHGTLNPGTNTTPASNLIQPEMNKTWAHPATTIDGLHKNISGGESATQLGASNRHAECQDCHNPHQAQLAVAKATRGPIRISAALKGTWGIEPTWPTPSTAMLNNDITWATITVYNKVANPTDEYQVCMKCHSGYVTLPVGKRNIAQEINPFNSSYHGIVPGGASNPFVNATTANEPWATNKRVWCSDCHGSESSTSPRGPHGSANIGSGPGTSNTDKMLIATIASDETNGTPLCLVCHRATSYWTDTIGSRYDQHDRGNHHRPEGCFACHMWDFNSTPANGGGNTGSIIAHGWNKRWYRREGTASTLGSGQMVQSFNGGYIADINYIDRTCWSEVCRDHAGEGYDPGPPN